MGAFQVTVEFEAEASRLTFIVASQNLRTCSTPGCISGKNSILPSPRRLPREIEEEFRDYEAVPRHHRAPVCRNPGFRHWVKENWTSLEEAFGHCSPAGHVVRMLDCGRRELMSALASPVR